MVNEFVEVVKIIVECFVLLFGVKVYVIGLVVLVVD